MATAKAEFNCGCNFRTPKIAEAVKHVEKTGHTLDGKILIVPDKLKALGSAENKA